MSIPTLAAVLLCTPQPSADRADWIESLILAPETNILVVRFRSETKSENTFGFKVSFSEITALEPIDASNETKGIRFSFDLSKQVWLDHGQFEGSTLRFLLSGAGTKSPKLLETRIEASIDSAQPISPVSIPDFTCKSFKN